MEDALTDQFLRFGGGARTSTLTLASLVVVVAAILLFFRLPRKYLVAPLLFVSTFIPYGQVIVVGGLHFMTSRILLPFAWLRMNPFALPKGRRFQFNGVDVAIVLWVLSGTICALLLWGEWGVVSNRLGVMYNVFGTYFLLRLAITDRDAVDRGIQVMAVLCTLIAVFMVCEQTTGRNVFSMFGGVDAITAVREGRIRSQAAFAHAIVAGTVGATLLPMFVGFWFQGTKARRMAVVGAVSGLVMTVTSSSATPVLALAAGIGALCMWPVRQNLRLIRWGVVILLINLHLVMKAPVWALISRVDIIGGNSGWHRFELINQAIVHFWDWFLVGLRDPSSWGFEMGDLSDGYVAEAVKGGFLTLLCFSAILWQGFRRLARARRAAAARRDRRMELLLWGFNAALFSNAVAFIGIWYFDQSSLIWYALLAMISAITSTTAVSATESERATMRARVPAGVAVEPQAAGVHTRHLFT